MSVPVDQMAGQATQGQDIQPPEQEMPQGPMQASPQIPPEWQQIIQYLEQRGRDTSHIVELLGNVDKVNLAEDLDEQTITDLGLQTYNEYEIDLSSRQEAGWDEEYDEFLKLASQAVEEKSYPWKGAANVKYPALTKAGIRFNARALPALIQGNNVVKGKVLGKDEQGEKRQRADRISGHMNFQLLHQMDEWQEGMDLILLMNPFVGTTFKKTYYSRALQRNVSDIVLAKNLVVNYNAPSFDRAPRKTECFELYPHEVIENQREGAFLDVDLDLDYGEDGDRYAAQEFLEQHRRFDLDDDGYPEPVVVTMHKRTKKIVRVVAGYDEDGIEVDESTGELARIDPIAYYTKYGFIPNPQSRVYDWGYGHLLRSLQGTIDTSINQMLDAGHLANAPGGFIGREMRMRSGTIRMRPGEYKPVPVSGDDVRKGVVDRQFSGPSQTMFALVEFLRNEVDDIASLQAVLEGNVPANSQPTTVLALIEQGLQPFKAIFKRLHQALAKELDKLFRLNRRYLNPQEYFEFLDSGQPGQITLQDYEEDDMGVVPVSDPSTVGRQEELAKAQALMQGLQDPMLNRAEIWRRYFEATNQEDVEALFVDEPPGPSPEQQAELLKTQIEERKQAMEEEMAPFERLNTLAQALERFAKAEAEEAGMNAEAYKLTLEEMRNEIEAVKAINEQQRNSQQRAMGGMAGKSGNAGGSRGVPGAGR